MNNSNVLIIGANGGIGLATAKILSSSGYQVFGTYNHNPSKYTEYQVDLSNLDSIKKLSEILKNKKFFGIINCAGIVEFENGEIDNDFQIWQKTLAVNLSSNYYLCKLFQDSLEENGRFIMISSTDSYYGGAITSAYSASKAGVNSLTKSLSLQLKHKKIRVNSIAPGWVFTPMIEGSSPEFYKKLAEINPLGKIADPQDIANFVKLLLSSEADYLNGQVLTLDGGYTNQDPTLLIEEDTK